MLSYSIPTLASSPFLSFFPHLHLRFFLLPSENLRLFCFRSFPRIFPFSRIGVLNFHNRQSATFALVFMPTFLSSAFALLSLSLHIARAPASRVYFVSKTNIPCTANITSDFLEFVSRARDFSLKFDMALWLSYSIVSETRGLLVIWSGTIIKCQFACSVRKFEGPLCTSKAIAAPGAHNGSEYNYE